MTKGYLLAGWAIGIGLAGSLAAPSAALAQDSGADAAASTPDSGNDGSFHAAPGGDIIVTAPFARDRRDVLGGTSVLQGAELTQSLRPTIGETLQRLPGVSATSFGPNASRPVLRGLQGERVRVLTDGIGSIDVSNTSVDHAVVINPLLAERVEVLRGPAALLYGSSAIGGVVNVLDKRIPRRLPDEPVHVDLIGTLGSASRERSGGGAIDAPLGDRIVLHADGSYLKTGDLRIGGKVLSASARAAALTSAAQPQPADAEPIDFAGNAELSRRLPNSAAETWTVGAGAAIITDSGNFGVSYSHYDNLYGVPVRYATEPGQGQEAPRIDLKQDRVDGRAEIQTGGNILSTIRARVAYATYRHFELEEDGAIGTAFYNKGMEGRLELAQAQHGAWKGASGLHYFSRDFDVVGSEAFLPRNATEQLGLFTLQQFDFGRLKLEGGGRYERSTLTARPLPGQDQFLDGKRSFGTVSGSAGASYAVFGEDWRIGANVSRTIRAPSAEELFANGPHAGTEAFEIGDPDLRKERAWGVEAVLRGKGAGYTIEASAYHNQFSNFIYEDRTGDAQDGLPVYRVRQADARYYGFEVQGSLTLAKVGAVSVVADGLADYVHATIHGVGPAPRIPPLRLLGGIGATSPDIDGRVEVEWSNDQQRVSAFETETAGFTLVNAEINLRPWGDDRPLSFAVSANNLFDVNARRHASFLKDFAPLAGRDFRVTARASF
ncbi:MAG: TonB-dependent receptor [Sphingomonas bacterium]|nr:TonB-dependent receptor [Sphingomonas bacterium]MDB5690917.1 TonB-dependent receptor [Sphingomonas bacterium]